MQKKLILFFSAIFIFVAITVIGSFQDEPLTPESAAAINYKPPIVPYEKNAFVALVAFNAPEDKNFMQAGLHIINRLNAKQPDGKFIRPPNGLQVKELPNRNFFAACLNSANIDCLQDANIQAKVNKSLLENSTLVARYKHMQALPIFSNTLIPRFELPNYAAISEISALLTINALIDIKQGRTEQGFSFLEQDVLFYRRMFSGHVTQITLIIANAKLSLHYKLLSLLIADPSFDAKHYALRLNTLLAPLAQTEIKLKAAMSLDLIPEELTVNELATNGLRSFTLKKNMTINAINREMPSDQFLANVHEYNFAQKEQEFNKGHDRADSSIFPMPLVKKNGIFFWKNIVGNILQNLYVPRYFSYIANIYDVAAYAKLVRTQLALRLAAQPIKQVPNELKQLGSDFNNPFSRQAFAWNPATHMLSFTPHGSTMLHRWNGLAEVYVAAP